MSSIEDLKKMLRQGIVEFTYTKVNGERRHAFGTLQSAAMEKWRKDMGGSKMPFMKREKPTTTYYDVEADGFRSFYNDSLVDINGIVYTGDKDTTLSEMVEYMKHLSGTPACDSDMKPFETHEATMTDGEVKDLSSSKSKKDILRRMLLKWPVPTIEATGFYVTDFTWRSLMSNIYNKVNTLMVGPAGTGKTELVRFMCKQMGIGYSHYNIGSMTDVQASLIGSHVIDAHGHSQFAYAQFVKDIQKPGVVMLDELNRNPQALNVLTNVLDGIRELNISGTGSDDAVRVKVHPSCIFFATANIGASYTGTSMIDEALETRFDFIGVNYIPEVYEKELLMKRTGIDAGNANAIASLAKQIRQLYEKEEISKSISTRETIRIAQKVSIGNTLNDSVRNILDRFEGTDADGERGIVYKIIAGV